MKLITSMLVTMYVIGILIVGYAIWEVSHNIIETVGVNLFWPVLAAALVADAILAGR